METIRKKICIDDCRSHKDGLLPYINSSKTSINTVNASSPNGNYGGYVCDFSILSAYTVGEKGAKTSKVLFNLQYLTLLKKYNFINKQLRECTFLKRINGNTWTNKFLTPNEDECDGDAIVNIPSGTVCDYKVYDENLFYFNDKNFTQIDGEISENVIIIIPNYDTVMQYEGDWSAWTENYKSNTLVGKEFNYGDNNYSNYLTTTIKSNLKFFFGFEKYALGRIRIPREYMTGGMVPDIMSYTEISSYKKWFYDHELISGDTKILPQWNNRGGKTFYDYLGGVDFFWQNNGDVINESNNVYFSYEAPSINYNILLTSKDEDEGTYYPYEYSVKETSDGNGNTFLDTEIAVNPYTPSEDSNLKPSIMESSILVESKLPSLYSSDAMQVTDEIFGRFEVFDESKSSKLNGGQLFKCTYYRIESSVPQKYLLVCGYTYTYTIKDGTESVDKKKFSNTSTTGETSALVQDSNAYQVFIPTRENGRITGSTSYTAITNDEGKTIKEIWSGLTETFYNYEWWECAKVTGNTDEYICVDGENVAPKTEKKYRNLSILSCILDIYPNPNIGDWYYYMARYDNGIVGNWGGKHIMDKDVSLTKMPLNLPYKIGEECNATTYDDGTEVYDVIDEMNFSANDSSMTITYTMGKTRGNNNSGIHYKETIPCTLEQERIVIDNLYNAEIYYYKLYKDKVTRRVYNKDYRLYRDVNLAEITSIEVGTQWTSENAITAPLITKEWSDSLQYTPIYDISVLYDRGAAAAWEKRYKLSECNTMEDLENYGNNYFKI